MRPKITDDDVRRIADAADVDPRTVHRALVGLPVKGRVGVRIAAAIKAFNAEYKPRHTAAS